MATSSRKGRIGQAQYWTWFGLYIAANVGLVGFALYSALSGALASAVTAILIITPLGLYFRVLMMRRCRDIGWPAFLPWLIFAASIGVSLFGGLGSLGSPTSMKAALLSGLGLPLLLSLIDLGFTITIGCIPTRDEGEDYTKIFGGEPQPARPVGYSPPDAYPAPRLAGPADAPDYDRFDEAIARALEARRSAEPAPVSAPPSMPEIAPSAHARAVAGFGRKVV
jgi:uncharacterized membrane protein YhaH (DUF805 family)